MRILVTGGNGFIGSHLVEALLKKGHDIRCLVRHKSDLQWIQGLDIEFIFGDATHPHTLKRAVVGVDKIYHLAGLVKAHYPSDYYRVNYLGTKNLIETCALYNQGMKRFIFCSSLAAAGPSPNGIPLSEEDECHPVSDYGKSKLKAETVLKKYMSNLPITVVRPPPIYGPRDREILNLFQAAKMGVLPLLGGRNRYVDICYVQDVVNALLLAGEIDLALGQTFFVSGGEICTWEEIGDIVSSILDRKVTKLSLPQILIDITVLMMESSLRLSRKPPSITRQKIVEMRQKYWICDSKKIRELLGYRPQTTVHDGIRKTIDWYSTYGWI